MIQKINFLLKLLIVFFVVSVSGCSDSEKENKDVVVEAEKVSKKISVPLKADTDADEQGTSLAVPKKDFSEKADQVESSSVETGDVKPSADAKKETNKSQVDGEVVSKDLSADKNVASVKKDGLPSDKEKKIEVEKGIEDKAAGDNNALVETDVKAKPENTSKFIKTLLGGNEKNKNALDSADLTLSYNPAGRINPFSPLVKESEVINEDVSDDDEKPKRPKTPLEKFDLSQLKLVAIMSTNDGDIAVLEESSGKGYLVEKGAYVGLNSGQIINIESDRIIIKETIKDISGKSITKESVLQIQKPVGE
ncbi:MAG: pilus assembly protein PilP [Desulforegulaceae bacterium]|nr:pilus assembly protein PilP [Desulforegulaceae bacterium]